MKRVATVIINRNLPEVTNKLYEHIEKYDKNLTDIYVLEAGSDSNCLSKYVTWHANWPAALKDGLRYWTQHQPSRGASFRTDSWTPTKRGHLPTPTPSKLRRPRPLHRQPFPICHPPRRLQTNFPGPPFSD